MRLLILLLLIASPVHANSYFESSDYYVSKNAIALASHINNPLSAIETGFDLLPDPVTGGTTGFNEVFTILDPTALTHPVPLGYLRDSEWNYIADTGTANALVVTLSPAQTALVAGTRLLVKVNADNTGASTIAVNGMAAKSIVRVNGEALEALDLMEDSLVDLVYDGTSFRLLTQSSYYQDMAASSLPAATTGAENDIVYVNSLGAYAIKQGTVTAGSGMTGGGALPATISHADTSSQASVNNAGATVVQDITLDTYGHTTSIASVAVAAASHTHDYVSDSGDTMTGVLTMYDSTDTIQFTTTYGNSASRDFIGASGLNVLRKNTDDELLVGSSSWDGAILQGDHAFLRATTGITLDLNGAYVFYNPVGFYPGTDNSVQLGRSAGRWTAVYAVNGTIQTSDENLKNIIGGVDASFIYALDPISYRWKEKDNGIHFGFPARKTSALLDKETFLVQEDEIYSIAYDELIAPMVQCIQDQKDEIDDLKNRLSRLEQLLQ